MKEDSLAIKILKSRLQENQNYLNSSTKSIENYLNAIKLQKAEIKSLEGQIKELKEAIKKLED